MKRILISALLLSGVAFADEPNPVKDNDGFEKVDGSMQAGESIRADRLVGAAYGFIMLAFVGYAVSIGTRSRRVEEEMDALRRKLDGK